MREEKQIEGVLTLLPTTFDIKGDLDLESFRQNICYLENIGMHGIVVSSSVGEFYALNNKEFQKLASIARESCKNMICVVNCSYQNIQTTIERVKYAEDIGADSAMVYPYHYVEARFSPDTYYKYFELMNKSTRSIRLMMFNDPRETKNLTISVELYNKLLTDFPRIIACVEDVTNVSEGGLVGLSYIFSTYGKRISMLTRSEAGMFIGMALGASGCLATYGLAMPKLLLRLYDECKNKKWHEALIDYQTLTRCPWQSNVVGVNIPGNPCALFPGTFTTSMGNTHVIAGQKVGTIFPGTAMTSKAVCKTAGRKVGDLRLPMLPISLEMEEFSKGWLKDIGHIE
jgi:dihydrodipicolinate synthase/N-acetylneuraminate lyase